MTQMRPEFGFERLLAALAQDLLDAPDAEILDVAHEIGQRPGMKGSIALLGVTFTFAMRRDELRRQLTRPAGQVSADARSPRRSRRRPKGDIPSSS